MIAFLFIVITLQFLFMVFLYATFVETRTELDEYQREVVRLNILEIKRLEAKSDFESGCGG